MAKEATKKYFAMYCDFEDVMVGHPNFCLDLSGNRIVHAVSHFTCPKDFCLACTTESSTYLVKFAWVRILVHPMVSYQIGSEVHKTRDFTVLCYNIFLPHFCGNRNVFMRNDEPRKYYLGSAGIPMIRNIAQSVKLP